MPFKLNISQLPAELQAPTAELMERLGFIADENGCLLRSLPGAEELSVTFDGETVTIGHSTRAEFFRGLRLVKQNLGKKSFTVREKRTVAELGVMLDCSRNAVRTVGHIKEIIRNLALMGYDRLLLYTEDTYEVEGEPFFGYMRGRFSSSELKEIDGYAYKFGIEVVPCIQTLAHLNQIFRWKAYRAVNDAGDILLIDDDRTYELIDRMFASMSENLRSRNIHIGMDEAFGVGRGKYEDLHGAVENRTALIIKHLERVMKIAEKYGYKHPMMWSDMFFHLGFGGGYYSDSKTIPEEVYATVPENLRLVYWDYVNTEKTVRNMVALHKNFKRDIVYAGGAWMWTGFAPCNKYSLNITETALNICLAGGIDKVLMTMWGDDGAECSDFSVLPTLVMTAEKVYGHPGYEAAFKALTDVDLKKFLLLDAVNEVGGGDFSAAPRNPCKYMLYSDCIGGLFDSAVRAGDGEVYKRHASALKAAEKTAGRYSYLFATQRALAEVLAIKYELGLATRRAYSSGDRAAVKALLKGSYAPLLGKLEVFYETFKAQWMKENKPFGFEIQDYRLGGLIRRVKHCAERLSRYAEGETDAIPELDERMLDVSGHGEDAAMDAFLFNNFSLTISSNIM